MKVQLPDQSARDQALNIGNSFIVQAPAGSGKTELLTLRYLKLLAVCDEPEEVLAITFTRKAASEMRDRVISVLNWAQRCLDGKENANDVISELRLTIAGSVLQSNIRHNWRLLDNPGRLRIQTIDSFCFYLANQLPILSQVGGNPAVTENIEPVFREAAKATLAQLEDDSDLADAIDIVLRHLDNDIGAIEQQLINLLYQRDQWANYIQALTQDSSATKHYLQHSLEELIAESLDEARLALHPSSDTLLMLLNYAAHNKSAAGELPAELTDRFPLSELPAASHADLQLWHFLLSILLKKDGDWLRAANKNHGFPPGNEKDERKALVESLQCDASLREALNYIRLLPDPKADDKQWRFQVALCHVLQALNIQLLLAFRNFKVVDYTQTGAAALMALGDSDQPTDLAMALDNVINHILVDEFQDTSQLQLELLQRLTAGWTQSDGRSLFLVGDAMQSCYGFRNANVGIYLGVLENGLGDLTLQALQLSSNFRSQRPVVEWVNDVFSTAFPAAANISRGAVPYSPADIIHDGSDSEGIEAEVIHFEPPERSLAQLAEADWVAEKVSTIKRNYPADSIAILVRTRSQLETLIPALRAAKLQWTATDIDRLDSLPLISDLTSLVRIVLHPGDRLAWLALLRAPWCGLDAADLLTLSRHSQEQGLWEALQDFESVTSLSSHARDVLPGFISAMAFVMEMRFRESLRHCVEAAWNLLRGYFVCQDSLDQASVERFYQLLDEQEVAGGLADFFRFEEILAEAFVPSPVADEHAAGLHLLTMHKAKGLEYDHVILPGLNRSPRSDDKNLLIWHQRLNQQNEQRLFLAGVTETGSEDSSLYQLLRYEQKTRQQLESSRLLYIAVTRARKSASILAILPRDKEGEVKAPESGSLLARIWQELVDQERLKLTALEDYTGARPLAGKQQYLDLPAITPIVRFIKPIRQTAIESELIQRHALEQPDDAEDEPQEDLELESEIGTLIHACLEHYVKAKSQDDYLARLDEQNQYWTLQLRRFGLNDEELQKILTHMAQSIRTTVNHPDLQWIFQPELEESSCELALSSTSKSGFVSNHIVDRSFIDGEGSRWIIDYKSGKPAPSMNEEQFIKSQKQRHYEQLDRYAELFAAMESRPTRKALLFTSLPRLVELD